MYVQFELLPPLAGVPLPRNQTVAVIALPPKDADTLECSRYMSGVREEIEKSGVGDCWYRLADGSRGGWFANPTLAIQELCHEIIPRGREGAIPSK